MMNIHTASRLWLIKIEMTVQPEDFPSGDTVGFVNVITWAESLEHAKNKISAYLLTFDWHVIDVGDAEPIDREFVYSDEIAEMIERAETNPRAILLGTFYSYKVN